MGGIEKLAPLFGLGAGVDDHQLANVSSESRLVEFLDL